MTMRWSKMTWLACLSLVLVTLSLTGCVDEDDDDEVDREAIKAAARVAANTIKTAFTTDLHSVKGHVQTLAAVDELKAVLNDPNATNNQSANDYLQAFNTAQETAVCYLMNASGITVAASNWDTNSSFVGKNYSFRPYFTSAMAGEPGEYFAVGVTTGVRGYYASYPVKEGDAVIGVVIIKEDLDYLEDTLAQVVGQRVLALLASPEGVIFMSKPDDLVLGSLGPLDVQEVQALTASKQFGEGPFEPLFDIDISDGDEVTLDDQQFLVTILSFNSQGWDLVLLSPV